MLFEREPAMREVFDILKSNYEGMTTKEIHDQRKNVKSESNTKIVVAKLFDLGYLERVKCHYKQRFVYSLCVPDIKPASANGINKMLGVYTCPELTSAPVRSGAMDAYKLPSIHMGVRVDRGPMLTRP